MSGCRTWQGRRATAPPRFRQGLAAIDHQRLPGDEAGLARGQEQRRPADVAHAAQTPQRHRARHLFQVVRAHLVQPLGEHVAGQDRIDRDVVVRQFQRGGAHETQLRRLAGRVVRPARIAGDGAGDRRGQDHAACLGLLQPGQNRPARCRARRALVFSTRSQAGPSISSSDALGKMPALAQRCRCRHGPAPRRARRRPSRCGRRRPRHSHAPGRRRRPVRRRRPGPRRASAPSRPRGRPVRPGLRRCPCRCPAGAGHHGDFSWMEANMAGSWLDGAHLAPAPPRA